MKKLLFAVEKFIEEQGFSLFITLVTAAVVIIITIVSWFWPSIYNLISDNHVFEAIVLIMLIEIITLLAERRRPESVFEVFAQDTEAQARMLELLNHTPIDRACILSSGLASRRLLIGPLARNGVKVEVLAQDPDTSLDKQDMQRLHEAIDWIRIDVGDKFFRNLKLLFHLNVTSLRAVVLYEAHSKLRHVFLGWYIYTNRSTAVRGSQNPTIYFSTRSKQGEQIAQWVETVIEKNKKESREVPTDF